MAKRKQKKSDRKFLLVAFLAVFLSVFIHQVTTAARQTGTVFGIKTDLFEKPTVHTLPVVLPTPAFYPKQSTDTPPPAISAASAIVLDMDSHVVLFAKDEHTHFPPASTTKIMTALVGIDYFAPDDILIVPNVFVNGAKMKLVPGEQITFHNLLYGLLLVSGNDAAETIAQSVPGGRDAFIATMNEKAKALHLADTYFIDPTGLSFENHYTTALDLVRLAAIVLKNETLAKVVSTKRTTVTDVSKTHLHHLENLNKLLGEVIGVIGLKTGYTEEAGQVLVTAATRDGHTLISVVLKSEDRFLDSQNLLEWAFANHTFIQATEF